MGQTRMIHLRDAPSQRVVTFDPTIADEIRLSWLPTADEHTAFRLALTTDVLRRTLEQLGARTTLLQANGRTVDLVLWGADATGSRPEYPARLALLEVGPVVVDDSGAETQVSPAEALESALRYFALTARYDLPWLYSQTGLDSAACALRQLRTSVAELAECGEPTREPSRAASELHDRFLLALSDGLDTAAALGLLWTALRADVPPNELRALLLDFDDVLQLGLAAAASSRSEALPSGARALIEARAVAREQKDWARSDTLRSRLAELGVETRDTPQGSEYRRTASASG